ncbi:hypothetical protein COY27_01180 [Candidatus Woesearchaeota archaeon CG_4_10_14_0_2_um_filter_33_13]|nr:MAG: hypothetical protein COY27_01180 [Candidatus Woesearchaeota archaeon CG_4_10_14_0_2_um_filter_33_13]
MTKEEYAEKEIHKLHFDFVGDKFNDKFKFTATDGNGGIYIDEIKAMTFKHAAMYLQKTYHSVLSLEYVLQDITKPIATKPDCDCQKK